MSGGAKEVVAVKKGFYDSKLRFAGDKFTVPEDAKADWFEDVGGEKTATTTGAAAAKNGKK